MITKRVRPKRRAAKRLATKRWNSARESAYKRKKARVPDYSFVHKKNILTEASIPKVKMEAGTIVRFSYRGIDVHEPRPLVLVLNPRWKNHLHGIALRVLSENELNKLAKMVKLTLAQKAAKLVNMRLNILKIDIKDPYKFYHKKLKPFIKKMDDSPYRTYTISGISATKIIDYRFKDMDTKVSKKLAKGFQPVRQYKFQKPKK